MQVTITAVTPANGPLVGGTSLTITGTNFTNVTSVTIGGSGLGSSNVVGTTQITGTTPAPASPGPKDVVVTSRSNGTGTCSGCFTYVQPLAAGAYYTCALTSGGAAFCWGDNYYGQLGTGSYTATESTPVAVSGGLTFSALAAGNVHTCGLRSSGAAYCWGHNADGQLGTATASATPVEVSGGLRFSALATGGGFFVRSPNPGTNSLPRGHTCGLTSAGAAYCWGANFVGQLGDGSTASSETPVAVSGGLSVSALATGGDYFGTFIIDRAPEGHTCGLTSNGAAYCWGDNGWGQLGNGTNTDASTPVAVSGGLRLGALAAGRVHACALTTAGAAYCWGANSVGQLGDGSTVGKAAPVAVSGGLSFNALVTGFNHTCGITGAGKAYCWGNNTDGRLGNGLTTASSIPVEVSGGLTFSGLAGGGLHTCGLTTLGAVYCWGDNSFGQLGNGSTTNSSIPVPVSAWP